jgi:hypothetical protein
VHRTGAEGVQCVQLWAALSALSSMLRQHITTTPLLPPRAPVTRVLRGWQVVGIACYEGCVMGCCTPTALGAPCQTPSLLLPLQHCLTCLCFSLRPPTVALQGGGA